jgi:hypothetical protein
MDSMLASAFLTNPAGLVEEEGRARADGAEKHEEEKGGIEGRIGHLIDFHPPVYGVVVEEVRRAPAPQGVPVSEIGRIQKHPAVVEDAHMRDLPVLHLVEDLHEFYDAVFPELRVRADGGKDLLHDFLAEPVRRGPLFPGAGGSRRGEWRGR